jgi:hypothetical protein
MKIAGKFPRSAVKAVDLFRGSKMKIVVLFAAAIALAGCDDLVEKPYVFKLPAAKAYDKLMAAPVTPVFGRQTIEITGKKYELVEWTTKGFGSLCNASLKPQGADKTRVDISCKDYGEGAAAGIATTMRRNRLIELVDATLRDRPYDPKKAQDGHMAARWPKDVIDHGTLGTAAGKALEMDRQMALELQQMQNASNR